MAIERDPMERLRALNPVRPGELDALVWAGPAQALYQRIVGGEAPAPVGPPGTASAPPRLRRRGPRVAFVAGVASLAVAAAGYALVGGHSSKPQFVACFGAADLQAPTAVAGVEGDGPVAACAGVWATGLFGASPTPPLRACLLESGVLGVFPEPSGRDVCLDLNLAAASASSAPSGPTALDQTAFLAFQDSAVARLVAAGCIAAASAEVIVRQEMERAGLRGWTVITGAGADGDGFSAARPCASLGFHPEQRTVVLVPLPGPPRD